MTLALIACEPPTDPIAQQAPRLLVQAVLDGGASQQHVYVAMTGANFATTLPVSGAAVSIVTPEGLVVAGVEDLSSTETDPGRPGFYRLALGGLFLRPGGTYLLTVRTQIPGPDGPIVFEATGSTIIPEATRAIPVTDLTPFDHNRDTLRLAWPRVIGAKSYQVGIRTEFRVPTGSFDLEPYTTFADTSIAIAGTARTIDNNEVFLPETSARVVVAAVDDNYYAYYHPTADPFAGAPASRLTGALGFFGSMVPVVALLIQDVR